MILAEVVIVRVSVFDIEVFFHIKEHMGLEIHKVIVKKSGDSTISTTYSRVARLIDQSTLIQRTLIC